MFGLISQLKFIDYVLLFWIVLWVAPQATLLPYYNVLWLLCYGIWILVIINNYGRLSSKEQKFFFSYIACFSIIFLEALVAGKSDLFHNMIELSQIPFIYLVFCYYRRCGKIGKQKPIIYFSVLLFLIFSITTIMVLLTNPYAARMIYVTGDKFSESQEYLFIGVGGYNFIYATLLLAIVVFYILSVYKRRGLFRTICIVLFGIFAALIVLSNFFTAFVLLLLSIALYFLSKNRKLFLPLALASLMIAPVYKEAGLVVIDGLSYFLSEEGRTYERLQSIRFSLDTGSKIEEDVDTRSEVKQISKDTFFDHPILGAVITTGANERNIGNHSTFLDALARYGIFVGGLLIILLLLPFLFLLSEARSYRLKSFVFCYAAIHFFLIFNNNLPIAGAYVSFFIYPISFLFIKDKLSIKNNNYK